MSNNEERADNADNVDNAASTDGPQSPSNEQLEDFQEELKTQLRRLVACHDLMTDILAWVVEKRVKFMREHNSYLDDDKKIEAEVAEALKVQHELLDVAEEVEQVINSM